jgi:hypothetical protein
MLFGDDDETLVAYSGYSVSLIKIFRIPFIK